VRAAYSAIAILPHRRAGSMRRATSLTLAGFAVMGLTLTLNRMGQAGRLLSIGLMGAGTALVFFGLYEGGWSR
jgi:hypothetical protein